MVRLLGGNGLKIANEKASIRYFGKAGLDRLGRVAYHAAKEVYFYNQRTRKWRDVWLTLRETGRHNRLPVISPLAQFNYPVEASSCSRTVMYYSR